MARASGLGPAVARDRVFRLDTLDEESGSEVGVVVVSHAGFDLPVRPGGFGYG